MSDVCASDLSAQAAAPCGRQLLRFALMNSAQPSDMAPARCASHLKWRRQAPDIGQPTAWYCVFEYPGRRSRHRVAAQATARGGRCASFPAQRSACLVFDHACFEKVAFLFKIDHFRHPGEGVFFLWIQRFYPNLLATAIGDEAQDRKSTRLNSSH